MLTAIVCLLSYVCNAQVSVTPPMSVTADAGYSTSILTDATDPGDAESPSSDNCFYSDACGSYFAINFNEDWRDAFLYQTKHSERGCSVSCTITHTVSRGAQVAVAHSRAISSKPSWLTSNWTLSEWTVTEAGGDIFDLYTREIGYADDTDSMTSGIQFTTAENTTDASTAELNYFVVAKRGFRRVEPPTSGGAGVVDFQNAAETVNEETGKHTINVQRTGGSTGAGTVNVQDAGTGTATATTFASVDSSVVTANNATPSDLTWAAGSNRAAICTVGYNGATNLTALTYRGQSMTSVASDAQGNDKSYTYAINDATANAGTGNSFSPTWSAGAPTAAETVWTCALVVNAEQTLGNWLSVAANYGAVAENFNESVNSTTVGTFALAFAFESDSAATGGASSWNWDHQNTDVASNNLLSWATEEIPSGGETAVYARGADREAGVMTVIGVPAVTVNQYALPTQTLSWDAGETADQTAWVDLGTVAANQTVDIDLATASGVSIGTTNPSTEVTISNSGTPPATTLPDGGLFMVWWSRTLGVDHPNLKGRQAFSQHQSMIPTGQGSRDYTQIGAYVNKTFEFNDLVSLQINGPKSLATREDYWYCNATGAPRETGDWSGAFWMPDGNTMMVDAFQANVDYLGTLSASQRANVLGIRVVHNAIRAEKDEPHSSCISGANYTRGTNSEDATSATSWTAARRDTALCDLSGDILDIVYPGGDGGALVIDGAYPYMRPNFYDWCNDAGDTVARDRLTTAWANGWQGFNHTGGAEEPITAEHDGHVSFMQTYLRNTSGGTQRAIVEAWKSSGGSNPGGRGGAWPTQPRYTNRQVAYWYGLQFLSVGARQIGYRDDEYALVSAGNEWDDIFNFVNLYYGNGDGNFHNNQADSPGVWVAFRQGNRFTGNYDLLATQDIATGDCSRGTERYAGWVDTSSLITSASTDYVGLPSAYNAADSVSWDGSGDRRSLWAYEWSGAPDACIDPDNTWAAAVDDTAVDVYVHYLNDSSGSFSCTLSGSSLGTVVTDTAGDWDIQKWDVAVYDTTTDDNLVCSVVSGTMILHRMEIRKDGQGGLW